MNFFHKKNAFSFQVYLRERIAEIEGQVEDERLIPDGEEAECPSDSESSNCDISGEEMDRQFEVHCKKESEAVPVTRERSNSAPAVMMGRI